MSAWPSQSPLRAPSVAIENLRLSKPRLRAKGVLLSACLMLALVAEGVAVSRSPLWAAPLICALVVAIAIDLPLVPLLGSILVVRILTDASLSSSLNRHTGSVNLSGAIAALFVLISLGLLIRRRKGVWQAVALLLFIAIWTGVAISSKGASTVTIREGVREASIAAVAVLVFNSRGVLNLKVVTRLIQVAGILSALLAIYQFATHKGVMISGHLRSNGTFSHPNGASMYYAIAATASLWRYLDVGKRRSDLIMAGIFAAATISTFSLGGLATFMVMLMVFGSLRPGAFRIKVGSYAVAFVTVVAFLATPLGAERLANESSTSLNSTVTKRTADTSLGWRFYKWQTLLPEWERGPFFGQGLGGTVTVEGIAAENGTTSKVPHNEYVRYLVETGLVGLAIVLWAVFMLWAGLVRRRKVPEALNGGSFALAIVAGCLFNALGDNTFLYSTTGYAVAMIVAAAYGIPKRRNSMVRRTVSAA
jgi:O-antigen ligase